MHYFTIELTQQTLNILMTLLSGLQILDIAVAVSLFYIYKKDHHYFNAIFLWIGMFLFFITDIILGPASNNHPLLSYTFVLLTAFNISKLIRKLYKVDKEHNYYYTFVFIFIAITFRFITPQNFTLIAFPISLAIAAPIFTALLLAIKNINQKIIKISFVDYIFLGTSLLWGLHFLDYPFLRELETIKFSILGFTLALILTYLLSILIPVVINRRIYLNINELIKNELTLRTRELARTQSLLYKQDKLASMGSLVAGVAHEIKNPLNIINTSNHYIKSFSKKYNFEELKDIFTNKDTVRLEKLKRDRERFNETNRVITTSVKRADQVIQTMLGHARGDESRVLVPTEVNLLIKETVKLIENSLEDRQRVEIQLELSDSLDSINTYINDLRRVIINILENSIYSISEKNKKLINSTGIIKIKTKYTQDKEHIQIMISDNGIGISHDLITRVFDPFMTTKPTGKGTGLGLSISQDIIKEHLGQIGIESEVGVGAELSLSISTNL